MSTNNIKTSVHRDVSLKQQERAKDYLWSMKVDIDGMSELHRLRLEFRKWVLHNVLEWGKQIVTVDGFDGSGKTTNTMLLSSASTGYDTNICDRYTMEVPTEDELKRPITEWYEDYFPGKGKTILFDRWWNNRALAQYPNGWCTEDQYEEFLDWLAGELERFLESGYDIHSFFFDIKKETQKRRLKARWDDPMKDFRLSDADRQAPKKYETVRESLRRVQAAYSRSSVTLFTIKSEDKRKALIELLKCLLKDADYPKKSKKIDFTPKTDLVKASVEEVLEVTRTKNHS